MPNTKPMAAGRTWAMPSVWLMKPMLGSSNDQTEAATITPEANPSRVFCTRGFISCFIVKTKAEPKTVPSTGISNPNIVPFM